mmetsp:Transcript_1211/g.4168  ORF Transcript_1211/g.4168 Transcript_1211/m.4168 type:complete len:607 (-) Transcript_1211:713-2533(-)
MSQQQTLIQHIASLYLNPLGADIEIYLDTTNSHVESSGLHSSFRNLRVSEVVDEASQDDAKENRCSEESQNSAEDASPLVATTTTNATATRDTVLANLPCFPAHKLILARSPVFKAMFFTSNLRECDTKSNVEMGSSPHDSQQTPPHIVIPDISEDAFMEFLRYLYTEQIELTGRIVLELLYASSKYQISELEQKCSEFLEQTIDVCNVLFLHQQARTFENKSLETRCMNYICRHGEEILKHESFTELTCEEALFFLDCDYVLVSELQRFEAALYWARSKWMAAQVAHADSENGGATSSEQPQDGEKSAQLEPTMEQLREQLGKILYAIRFTRMEEYDFAKNVVPSKILTQEEIISLFSYIVTKGETAIDRFSVTPRDTLIWRVLVLGGDQVNHIEDVSQHIREAHSSDSWYHCGKLEVKYHNARDSSPSIEVLSKFDSVLVFSNYSFHSPSLLGDRLADYVDNGGGCVIATFACVKKYNIQGRFLSDGYMGVTLGENTTLPKNQNFERVEEKHPILHSIKDFDPGRYRGEIDVLQGNKIVAQWYDNVPLVVETSVRNNEVKLNGRVVTLNFFPVSNKLNAKYWSGEDGGKLLLNSLIYCSGKYIE